MCIPFLLCCVMDIFSVDWEDINKRSLEILSSEREMRKIEGVTFWCALRFIDRNKSIFEESSMRTGEFIHSFADLVALRDRELDDLFGRLNINYFHFAFRWFICLLQREFPSQWLMTMWDTYISQPNIQELFPHICFTYLQSFRHELLHSAEFESCLLLLHRPPPSLWSASHISTLLPNALLSHKYHQLTVALPLSVVCVLFPFSPYLL